MRRRRDDEVGQLQLLESILVAVFIFIAIAVVAVYRLPTNPGTFQVSELQNVGVDTLKVRQAKVPGTQDDCNQSPCPFTSDLDRIWSLAMGYRGKTLSSGESPDTAELKNFLDQALPPGSRYIFVYSNGYNDTKLLPRNATPPAADVVVARSVATPNWTVNASLVGVGPTLRLGEAVGSAAALTDIIDPLGRNTYETGVPLASFFANGIPMNATFGTYTACVASGCSPLDVVPPGMAGPGSYVLDATAELPVSSSVLGRWDDLLRFNNTDGAGGFTSADDLYLSSNAAIDAGDVRLTRVANCRGGVDCPPGSTVRTGDADVGYALASPGSADLRYSGAQPDLSAAVALSLDADGTGTATTGDVLVTRQGFLEAGASPAYASGQPYDWTLTGASSWVVWWDQDGNGTREEEEPLWLNLTSSPQSEGLEPYDVVLSPGRLPPRLWPYDLKVVIWYGV